MDIIQLLLYVMLIVGLVIANKRSFKLVYANIKLKEKAKKLIGNTNKEVKEKDEVYKHLDMLLAATLRTNSPNKVMYFCIASVSIGCIVFILLNSILSIRIAVLFSLGSMIVPYTLLMTKLQNMRVNISREGEILITELLNNYKINYYNMPLAIEQTAMSLEDAPNSKALIFNLAKGFNTASGKAEIKKLLDIFRYSIGTTWSNILCTNIYFAQVNGLKVTTSLADLADSINKARKILEHSKRENSESVLMLRYLVPICMILTVAGAIKYFGFTLHKYMEYQFGTATGVLWFLIVITSYIAGIIVTAFLSRKKMDL